MNEKRGHSDLAFHNHLIMFDLILQRGNKIQIAATELHRLLGIIPIEGQEHSQSEFFKELKNLLNAPDFDVDLFMFFIQDLQELEKYRPDILRQFKKQVDKNPNMDFYGFRHEVKVAAAFAKNDVFFDKRETPDFQMMVDMPSGKRFTYLECKNFKMKPESFNNVPRHVFTKKMRYIGKEINKESKKYREISNVGLAVGLNNIIHCARKSSEYSDLEVIAYIQRIAYKHNFGAIVLFWYEYNGARDLIHGYKKIQCRNTDPRLQKFLDHRWPTKASFSL